MNPQWVEWIGYLASFLVLISLLMSSILKLRWINLLGSTIFSIYGFIIGSLPVAFMNMGTAFINIYYLVQIYKSQQKKDYFKLLKIDFNSKYFNYFMEFHKKNILEYFPEFDFHNKDISTGFYILRNLVPAGIFLGSKYDETTLLVNLDYAIPEYRDFKIGNYIYEEYKDYFLNLGYNKLMSHSASESHNDYLLKMGFKEKIKKTTRKYL